MLEDIFAKINEDEELVKKAEENLINANTQDSRAKLHCINVKNIRFLKINIHCYSKKVRFIG